MTLLIYIVAGLIMLGLNIKNNAKDVTVNYTHTGAMIIYVLVWPFAVLGLILGLWDEKD